MEEKDFAELKKNAKSLDVAEVPDVDDTAELVIAPKKKKPEVEGADDGMPSYNGPGAITDAPRRPAATPGVRVGAMENAERRKDAEDTLHAMDQEIAANHRKFKEIEKQLEEKGAIGGSGDAADSPAKKVEVIIDKFGLWRPTFTDEEKKKLEVAEKIKLTEVTDVKLKSLKIKKKIKDGDMKLVKQTFNRGLTPIIALASGYTCKMKSISMAEAINLYQNPGTDTGKTLNEKWSLIYDKIVDPSIGPFEDYEDFCRRTAFSDYNMFLYGLICTSYPEKDSQHFVCEVEKCKKEWNMSYTNQELFRSELVTEEQQEYISKIVSAAASISTAKEVCAESVFNSPKLIKISETSGVIAEISTPSIYDMINTYIEDIRNSNIPNIEDLQNIMGLAVNVRKLYVPSDDDGYYEVEGTAGVMEVLGMMNEYDIGILRRAVTDFVSPSIVVFGFKKVVCPVCKHDHGMVPVELDNTLFQHVRRRVMQEIE